MKSTALVGATRILLLVLLLLLVPALPSEQPPNELLVGFLPNSGMKSRNRYHLGAFMLAMEELNQTLAPLSLHYTMYDNQGSEQVSMRAMTKMKADGAVAFIGPEDTCATEGRLASAWNLPMITFVSVLPVYYTYFYSTHLTLKPVSFYIDLVLRIACTVQSKLNA